MAALLLLAAFTWSLGQLGRPRRLAVLWLPPLLLLPSATAWLLLGWKPLLGLVGLVGATYCRESALLLAGPANLALLALPSLLALLLLPLQLPLAVLVTLLEAVVEAHWERSPENPRFWSRNLACLGVALLFYGVARGLWALNHPRTLGARAPSWGAFRSSTTAHAPNPPDRSVGQLPRPFPCGAAVGCSPPAGQSAAP